MVDITAAGTDRRARDPTAADASAVTPPVYMIGSNAAERDRLRSQTDELHEHSVALLERVGIQPGWNVLELPCLIMPHLSFMAWGRKPDHSDHVTSS